MMERIDFHHNKISNLCFHSKSHQTIIIFLSVNKIYRIKIVQTHFFAYNNAYLSLIKYLDK